MKLTLIQTGDVPAPLSARFAPYPRMFEKMFEAAGAGFSYETIRVAEGEPLPDPAGLEAVLLTGSAAGVYDDLEWLDPLRVFIRGAHAAGTPMVGVCFGHQIIADALGGVVRKSEKGWGLGRHDYAVTSPAGFMGDAPRTLSVVCSHQDQVIEPPPGARVILASDFTPNAGLLHSGGTMLGVQPHPEFSDAYVAALAELRRGRMPDETVETALGSLARPSDGPVLARWLARFLREAGAARTPP